MFTYYLKPVFSWNKEDVPEKLAAALRTLAEYYPVAEGYGEKQLIFRKGDALSVSITKKDVTVTYTTMASALRGLGLALAGVKTENEHTPFETFGVMIDVSRNAVMKISYAKTVLRRLALMGYNMALLYAEDIYQLPDEPHFGYLRGAYSLEEVRELDDYADSLGIELIGCIQTLGHLDTFLRTKGSKDVRDTGYIMLAEEEKTYTLIGKMIDFWSKACRSRRIHIGMDEAWGMGSGEYKKRHGEVRPFDIFNRHLAKVNEICLERGLNPMIWSDMYFRMGSKTHDYYDRKTVMPPEVQEEIPKNVQLVYWDYYHLTEDFYDDMIAAHRKIGCEPPMGSAIWTWYRFFYDHEWTVNRVKPCIDSCFNNGIKEFFFTMWGDDGAYCDFETVFAGLLWCADRAYGIREENPARQEKVSRAIGCSSFKQSMKASLMNYQASFRDNGVSVLSVLFAIDPILQQGWHVLKLDDEKIRAEILEALEKNHKGIKDYPYAAALGRFLTEKIKFQLELQRAYKERDMEAIHKLHARRIPKLLDMFDDFICEFRCMWVNHNKYEGMECMQNRQGGIRMRYLELAERLFELENGWIDSIPELDQVWDERCFIGESFYTLATNCRL